ncbi:hypothetical protein [Streptomyces sp. HM190]|uniref:hypothetical protein n=1 Tax=Streptomyces sp. HM190 TaxID=2695266 RepID=UPI0019176782|nr:hypothetical protein [Streptomyces sp. HM190]
MAQALGEGNGPAGAVAPLGSRREQRAGLLTCGSHTITHDDDPYGPKRMGECMVSAPTTDLDLHDLIRKDA